MAACSALELSRGVSALPNQNSHPISQVFYRRFLPASGPSFKSSPGVVHYFSSTRRKHWAQLQCNKISQVIRASSATVALSSSEEGQGLKLLGTKWSPFVGRVRMSLKIRGIQYEFVEDLKNKSELLLQLNPIYKKIPVLIHNGKPICKSLVILEYIEETWPSSPHPLLPSDPYDRALSRFWASFVDDQLLPSLTNVFRNPDNKARAKGIEEAKANVALLEDALKSMGKGKTYFGGDRVGMVDLVFASLYAIVKPIETLAEVTLLNNDSAPALSALLEAVQGNEAVKDLVPDPAVLIEFIRKRFPFQPQA